MAGFPALGAAVAAAALAVAFGLHGSSRSGDTATSRPLWHETKWPFSGDPWGEGKAYLCHSADCGAKLRVYLRAKLGLCNCATGIDDDADLERMGDLYLVGTDVVPEREGRPIVVGHMKGRSRAYVVAGPDGATARAIAIGYSDRCDMIVATGLVQTGRPDLAEAALLEFLNSPRVLRWTESALGL